MILTGSCLYLYYFCVCAVNFHNSVLFTDPQMRELEIPKSVAERSLREHKGDLIKALHSLTD